MKPLFTLHAGEYLVGAHIEQSFKRANVWVPSRDTGIDLLVSDGQNRNTVSLQVKFSKDFLVTNMRPAFREKLRACGWWAIKWDKLVKSQADYWVFVVLGFASRTTDFVVIPRQDLIDRLGVVHGASKSTKILQTYIWVTSHKRCWETRGLIHADQQAVADGDYQHPHRDLTKWLNNWDPVARLDR